MNTVAVPPLRSLAPGISTSHRDEPALGKTIRRLKRNHLNSIRLMWFLSEAHTAHDQFEATADYSFVRDVRDVMEGRQ